MSFYLFRIFNIDVGDVVFTKDSLDMSDLFRGEHFAIDIENCHQHHRHQFKCTQGRI